MCVRHVAVAATFARLWLSLVNAPGASLTGSKNRGHGSVYSAAQVFHARQKSVSVPLTLILVLVSPKLHRHNVIH